MANENKKRITQNELRRIMSEQKKKFISSPRKIESPLAKYKEDGTLTCIVCESIIRNDAVWIVHLNSKQHKDNIARKKQQLLPPKPPPEPPLVVYKRPATPPPFVPAKKLKGILKNAPAPKLPEGFFESEIKSQLKTEAVKEITSDGNAGFSPEMAPKPLEAMETEEETDEEATGQSKDPLPEGFFDDPVMDAKARNVEYKDPIQEEWERFQKEIKEQTTVSTQIIEGDTEEATTERQIHELDEQLSNWSRVLDLEKKKEAVQSVLTKSISDNTVEESSGEDDDFDEFLDWRAKKAFK
uniref:Zinc finger protein 830 n=1 Tax=Homalodisca liturata TaxID=320908 RepID=A0A1B6K007_9HEMI